MTRIHVCALSQLPRICAETGASHVLSVVSGGTEVARPPQVDPTNHLLLSFNDIVSEEAGLSAPGRPHVEQLLGFIDGWDRKAPMVIHCWAGVSRSTAAAYIACCALNPKLSEHEIAQHLRQRSPKATPNIRMVGFADEILQRQGRMTSAIAAIGRGAYAYEGDIFSLDVPLNTDSEG